MPTRSTPEHGVSADAVRSLIGNALKQARDGVCQIRTTGVMVPVDVRGQTIQLPEIVDGGKIYKPTMMIAETGFGRVSEDTSGDGKLAMKVPLDTIKDPLQEVRRKSPRSMRP